MRGVVTCKEEAIDATLPTLLLSKSLSTEERGREKMQWLMLMCVLAYTARSWAEEEGALVTEKVFLDLQVEGDTERVVIGLFGSTSPKTVRNFVGLATHEVREAFSFSVFFY